MKNKSTKTSLDFVQAWQKTKYVESFTELRFMHL